MELSGSREKQSAWSWLMFLQPTQSKTWPTVWLNQLFSVLTDSAQLTSQVGDQKARRKRCPCGCVECRWMTFLCPFPKRILIIKTDLGMLSSNRAVERKESKKGFYSHWGSWAWPRHTHTTPRSWPSSWAGNRCCYLLHGIRGSSGKQVKVKKLGNGLGTDWTFGQSSSKNTTQYKYAAFNLSCKR